MADVAIVTGGAGGIGSAICTALAQDGLRVVVADLKKDDAEILAAQLKKDGNEALAVAVDVGDKDSVAGMMDQVLKKYGQLDFQINTAGVRSLVSVRDMSAKEWDRVLGINLRGIFLCSQAAAEAMRKRKQGRILNTASNRGVVGEPNASHYAASKAGVIAFTKSMAKEVAPDNILVNAIAPGWTETPMGRAGVTDEYWQKIKSVPPLMGGLTEKDEITGLVRYLLSYATRYITGQLFFLRSPYK